MPPRVLVLSASVGAGHMRAAQAVELALRKLHPDAAVQNLDILQLTNAVFRRLYGKAYLDLVNHAPHVLGYVYDMLDRAGRWGRKGGDRLRLVVEKLNLAPFLDHLTKERWDLVINTHFLPAEIIASLKTKGELSLPQVTVTTDFDTHRLWVNQPCERYFTATEEGRKNLAAWGVPEKDIQACGIPIHPVFAEPKPRSECCRKQGLVGDRTIVLQLAGGFGVGPITEIHRAILAVTNPLEIVVVTGRNAEAKEKLEPIPCPRRHRRKILGFTDQIDELMGAADLVVSKPGGLTTSETLARGAAMVVVDPIPGQETRNSDYLLENGAAIKVNNLSTAAHKIEELLGTPGRLEKIRENALRIARPRAAFDVVEQSLALVR
jgi:processive 1,2-diacylglycerol beta-glucosyltransferase